MSRLRQKIERIAPAPKGHAVVRKLKVQARGESGPIE